MVESDVMRVLISLGLKRNESRIYLDLIKKGKSSVTQISKRTGIYRSNIYAALGKLTKDGLANQCTHNGKRLFYAMPPSSLYEINKIDDEELKITINKLNVLQSIDKNETKVAISEGLNALRTILLDFLNLKKPIYVYGVSEDANNILGGFLKEYHRIRIENKTELKRIHKEELIQRVKELNKMKYTQARFIRGYSSEISTHVCANKVAIIIWDFPVSTILIENEHIANSYRDHFFMLWEKSEIPN